MLRMGFKVTLTRFSIAEGGAKLLNSDTETKLTKKKQTDAISQNNLVVASQNTSKIFRSYK